MIPSARDIFLARRRVHCAICVGNASEGAIGVLGEQEARVLLAFAGELYTPDGLAWHLQSHGIGRRRGAISEIVARKEALEAAGLISEAGPVYYENLDIARAILDALYSRLLREEQKF